MSRRTVESLSHASDNFNFWCNRILNAKILHADTLAPAVTAQLLTQWRPVPVYIRTVVQYQRIIHSYSTTYLYIRTYCEAICSIVSSLRNQEPLQHTYCIQIPHSSPSQSQCSWACCCAWTNTSSKIQQCD